MCLSEHFSFQYFQDKQMFKFIYMVISEYPCVTGLGALLDSKIYKCLSPSYKIVPYLERTYTQHLIHFKPTQTYL